jgi:phenylacetate-coenzyme A ligase PaaK-like adenylate-forming protein
VAETLCSELVVFAEEVWGASVCNRYNSTETFAAGSECECRTGIHLPEDLVIYESVDEKNHPVPDGTVGAGLLVTTLTNRAMPLIRYAMSDIVSITRAPCVCGRPYARFTRIEGRREEYLLLRVVEGSERCLHAGVLRQPLIRVAGLQAFQFSVTGGSLCVRYTVQPGADAARIRTNIETMLARSLREQRILGVQISLEAADVIARVGTGEKERLVLQV